MLVSGESLWRATRAKCCFTQRFLRAVIRSRRFAPVSHGPCWHAAVAVNLRRHRGARFRARAARRLSAGRNFRIHDTPLAADVTLRRKPNGHRTGRGRWELRVMSRSEVSPLALRGASDQRSSPRPAKSREMARRKVTLGSLAKCPKPLSTCGSSSPKSSVRPISARPLR